VKLNKLDVYDRKEEEEMGEKIVEFTFIFSIAMGVCLILICSLAAFGPGLFKPIIFSENQAHHRICVCDIPPHKFVGTHITKERCWANGCNYIWEVKEECSKPELGWTLHEIGACIMHGEEISSERCIDKYNQCYQIESGNMNIVWGEE
jgi:hypothetical protein